MSTKNWLIGITGLWLILLASNALATTVNRTEIIYKDKRLKISDDGRALIQMEGSTATVTGFLTIVPRDWQVYGTSTISIPPLGTTTYMLPIKDKDYYLQSINIAGRGGDTKIKVSLPNPNYSQLKYLTLFNPNLVYDYGEGILIPSGSWVTMDIQSLDGAIGIELDISWQSSFKN